MIDYKCTGSSNWLWSAWIQLCLYTSTLYLWIVNYFELNPTLNQARGRYNLAAVRITLLQLCDRTSRSL